MDPAGQYSQLLENKIERRGLASIARQRLQFYS